MALLNLPVEIGSKIFSYLNLKTQIYVYEVIDERKDYFAYNLKKVVLSRSTLATVKTLDERLFLDLGEHITELNLSGVPDLTVENLTPHIIRFVNLKSLDVTFTSIYLADITEICTKNLKNIAINFFNNYGYDRITDEAKQVFEEKQFEVVHFVITELSLSALPLMFLKDLKCVKDLKLTVSGNVDDFLWNIEETNEIDINFNKFTLFARDCAVSHRMSKDLDGIVRLNFEQLEYIFLMKLEQIEIYVSPLLSKLFSVSCSDLKIEVISYLPTNFMLDGNIVFKAWNKETTSFDQYFFEDLQKELADYFPTYFCLHGNGIKTMKIIDAPSTWYCIDNCEMFDTMPDLPDKITLSNYCRRTGALLKCWHPISLVNTSKSLQGLTFLGINNIPISKTFFTVLFQQALELKTLNIYVESSMRSRSYIQSLTRSMHLANLRNFFLSSKNIQYEALFDILSRCPSLENVHICEYNRDLNDEIIDRRNIFRFLQQCFNLYSLFVEANMSPEGLTMMMAPLRTMAQKLERDYLYIEVCRPNWSWNPYADVFSPSPLHIFNI